MDPENGAAAFLRHLTGRLGGPPASLELRQTLAELDWRSPMEFYGYLRGVLDSDVDTLDAMLQGNTAMESCWLYFLQGLKQAAHSRCSEALGCFTEALRVAHSDEWVFYLALAAAEQMQQQLDLASEPRAREAMRSEFDRMDRLAAQRLQQFAEIDDRLTALRAALIQPEIALDARRELLEQLLGISPDDKDLLLNLIYVDAAAGAWERARQNLQALLERPGRESHNRLSAGLLNAEILRRIGREEEANLVLLRFGERTLDPWYDRIADCLLGGEDMEDLIEAAATDPAHLLTARVALGLWSEGADEMQPAIEQYREALASYRDDLPEYRFALERIRRLRKPVDRVD
jgi:tetratricopeptide (TPR) repeat protein